MICNFWNFFPFSKNVDYYMQFLEFRSNNMDYDFKFTEFISLLKKRGLLYAMSEISIPSLKTWTIICNFSNFFPFSKNVDYYMQFLEFRSKNMDYDIQFMEFLPLLKNVDYHKQFLKFLSLLPKRGLYLMQFWEFHSLFKKTWTIISIYFNLFHFSKNVDYHIQFIKFL